MWLFSPSGPQLLLHLFRTIGRIGPNPGSGIAPHWQMIHRLTVVQRGIADMITSDQLVLAVDIHMVLVTEVALTMLLRPVPIRVLFGSFDGLVGPVFGPSLHA